jgi:hypothetical protein
MKPKTPSEPLVEIIRSYSYKLNVGNYESRDFFASQKAFCKPEEREEVSMDLDQFVQDQVMKSVNHYQAVQAHRAEQRRNQ